MIKVVCPHCKESIEIEKEGFLEINFNEKAIYFKCPKCSKYDRQQLYKEEEKFPRIRGLKK